MIGLGTYSFFWQHSTKASTPLDLAGMLELTRALDVNLFQICDYLPLLELSTSRLTELRSRADDLGITLELGTRGVGVEHLRRFLGFAEVLGARVIRSMIYTADERPTLARAQLQLEAVLPAFEAAGVTIALETYEQLPSRDLVSLIEAVGSDSLGICLDPANCVAALENPVDVINLCAPYVANIHVKDFAFTRRGGWVGFTLEGAPLGTGLLDWEHLLRVVQPNERGINLIIEHWLPWHDTLHETARLENHWTTTTLAHLRSTT